MINQPNILITKTREENKDHYQFSCDAVIDGELCGTEIEVSLDDKVRRTNLTCPECGAEYEFYPHGKRLISFN